MELILQNLRLHELTAIVRENRAFYDEFLRFLQETGYDSVADFIQDESDQRAAQTITTYLNRQSTASLYDGLLRPYTNAKAKWFFLAWLLRDAATQRLQPLLKSVPGDTDVERKSYLLNEVRKFVAPLFPDPESWEWAAVSKVMLARLEGSRRALKGTLFEGIVRRTLEKLILQEELPLEVNQTQVKLADETYDIQVTRVSGTLLIPVKTRETMGGGHALLFTRDIFKAVLAATERGYRCVPVVIAESWTGNLEALDSERYIYIQANPNQIASIEPILAQELKRLLPILQSLAIND